jgi:hypothetical protein
LDYVWLRGWWGGNWQEIQGKVVIDILGQKLLLAIANLVAVKTIIFLVNK